MRLIDIDARVTVFIIDPETDEYEHYEMTVEEALDFATDEGCPPTIDAIPVSWLNQVKADADEAGDKHLSSAIQCLVAKWERRKQDENQ